jgi:NAD(P)-dependent dehydrogenase (short-subunit alcohol dehydrogenase family)
MNSAGIARVFAGNGWHVVGVDVVAAKDASIVHEYYHVDLAQADSIDRFVQTVHQLCTHYFCFLGSSNNGTRRSTVSSTMPASTYLSISRSKNGDILDV